MVSFDGFEKGERAMLYATRLLLVFTAALCLLPAGLPALGQDPATQPARVYVPYEKLRDVFETERQGVFLPYDQFQRLWTAARGAPAAAAAAPLPYLVSTARFTGQVRTNVAELSVELTVDVLRDGWVEVPVGLGEVAVSAAEFNSAPDESAKPLLRVRDGRYFLLVHGKGRWVLNADFVAQLQTSPGQNVLQFRIPSSAISTLELLIPEENMKVDVEPLLAATTEQVPAADGQEPATRLLAFLGSSDSVRLSWAPKSQAAEDLDPVVICEQLQHLDVGEALLTHDVLFRYDIRRRGVGQFTIQLPADARVTAVEGANISDWAIEPLDAADGGSPQQRLTVTLFSDVKGPYELQVRMEQFLKDAELELPLTPIVTQEVLRRTGLIAVTHSPRRSVEVRAANQELVRVDVGRLPDHLRNRENVTAWRFTSGQYAAALAIGTVDPRLTVRQLWHLAVDKDRQVATGVVSYRVERVGVFALRMHVPEPWQVETVTSPSSQGLVDDYELQGQGPDRTLHVTLKQEMLGDFALMLTLRSDRPREDGPVRFELPAAAPENVHQYTGEVLLAVSPSLEPKASDVQQLQPIPLVQSQAVQQIRVAGHVPVMAYEFRAIDRARPAFVAFDITVKPAQVSAAVHRLVDIQPGSVQHSAILDYTVLYAPVDTFYLKLPASVAGRDVQIGGADVKESPRIPQLPPDQQPAAAGPDAPPPADGAGGWAYYKVVLQSPVTGTYRLNVSWREPFQAGEDGRVSVVDVSPVLAAGKVSDQSGTVAVAKAPSLTVGTPKVEHLIPADPGSAGDLPYAPHRQVATLAFKYTGDAYALSLPVQMQKEAAVFATIANAALVEQVLGKDGALTARAVFLLSTSRGDRLSVTLPEGARVYPLLLNGQEVAVESPSDNVRVVRLPHSAGQVAKHVLEVTYGLEGVSGLTRELPAPVLPDDVPVQRTFWLLWVPVESRLVAFDRDFAREQVGGMESLFNYVAAGHPQHLSKFPTQGRPLCFARQHRAPLFAVTLLSAEVLVVLVWVVVLAVGVVLLWFGWFVRAVAVLAAVSLAAIANLFVPLLVPVVLAAAVWPAMVVLALWVVHWLFRGRGRRSGAIPPPPVAPVVVTTPGTPQGPGSAEGPADAGRKE